jgi:hypothetical protein
MVPVFSRTPPKPCSKTILRMVLAAVQIPSGAGDAWSLSEPPGTVWEGFAGNGWYRLSAYCGRRHQPPNHTPMP